MPALVVKPRYVALDTAHLSRWIADYASSDRVARAAATGFEAWLEDNGWVVLLCMHHIEELANHDNEAVALARLRFVGARKFLAWIGEPLLGGPGNVATILSQELRAALEASGARVAEVRDRARERLLRTGTGAELLIGQPEEWLELRPLFAAQAEKARAIVAFTREGPVDIEGVPIAELLRGTLRRGDELRCQLRLMEGSIAVHIAQRGDRRIKDHGRIAKEFVDEVTAMAQGGSTSAPELILRTLASQGITAADIKPNSTVGELLELGMFRTRLRIAAEAIGLSHLLAAATVLPEQLPSWRISRAVTQHTPDLRERQGGELTDTHLACLSAYADVTFVDKRTLEAFRRFRREDPGFTALLGRVERAASYRDIPALLQSA